MIEEKKMLDREGKISRAVLVGVNIGEDTADF